MGRAFVVVSVSIALIIVLTHSILAVPVAPWEVEDLMGNKAPDFTLKDLNDKDVSLGDFEGKVILINFWATWCPPCKEEIPSLNQLYEKYKDKEFVLVSISTDDSKKSIVKFARKYNIKFMVLHDKDSKVMRKYKGFSLPMSFLIDKKGKIVEKYLGAHEWAEDDFIRKIEGLM